MKSASLPTNFVDVSSLPKKGRTFKLVADDAALLALAELTVAESVEKCDATITARPWKMNGAVLRGEIQAIVNQSCVSTLEPIRSNLELELVRYFLPDVETEFSRDMIIDGELIIDPEADDLPDPLENGVIDIWKVILEELNLQIDPYPKLENFDWGEEAGPDVEDETHRPFADLKSLITKKNSH